MTMRLLSPKTQLPEYGKQHGNTIASIQICLRFREYFCIWSLCDIDWLMN